jgi:hypothetical protein
MGQRHQIFIRIENPVKYKNSLYNDSEKKKLRKLFGGAKYSVIALHHQWLYGRSAIAMLHSILNVTNKETMGHNNPFNSEGYYFKDGVDDFIKDIMGCLQLMTCPLAPRGIGIERMHFLNDEDGDIRKNFTYGDNNDGITIIDTIENKYCFMNIFSQEVGGSGVYGLPSMTPSSAMDYMNAYYGVTKESLGTYYTKDKTDVEIQELIENNKLGNAELESLLNETKVTLLSLKEVKKMFPNVYSKKTA